MQQKRISNKAATVFIALALALDVVSLVPLVRLPMAVVAQFVFYYLFGRKHVDMLQAKKSIALVLGTAFELMPALAVLPALTIEVIAIIALSRVEDRKKRI
jgi:hypothetical protein